jgi:hypothetical protein
MTDQKYVEDLEKRNDELMDKLASAESQLRKIGRKKGTYPVFKLLRTKIKRATWIIDCEYLTNCDCVASIIPTITYAAKNPKEDDGELVGFQYWRQSINYRWALAGMSRYLDMNLKPVYNIEINTKTGDIYYKSY